MYSCRLTNDNGYTDSRFASIYARESLALVVDTLADSVDASDGVTSLREAMNGVIAYGAGNISFLPSLSGTINLTAPLPRINCAISISGGSNSGGSLPIRIDGGGTNSLFSVESAVSSNGNTLPNSNRVSIRNLTLSNGLSKTVAPVSGALQIYGGTVLVRGVTFQNNAGVALTDLGPTTANCAGAVTVQGGEVNLSNCTFTGNTGNTYSSYVTSSGATGGAGAVQVNGGNVAIQSCTLVGNTGGRGGGALYKEGSGNVGTRGVAVLEGFICGVAALTISNSIICNNAAGVEGPGTVAPGTSAAPNAAGSYSTGGPNLIDVDPKLAPLADNGGPTQTFALLPGSPAINAGATGYVTSASDFDQRGVGYARVKGGRIDIGAFESGPTPPQHQRHPGLGHVRPGRPTHLHRDLQRCRWRLRYHPKPAC